MVQDRIVHDPDFIVETFTLIVIRIIENIIDVI